jgi:hypothetical protein
MTSKLPTTYPRRREMSALSTDKILCRHFEGLRPSGIFKEALLGRLRVRGKGLRPS